MKNLIAAMALVTIIGVTPASAGDATFLTSQTATEWSAQRLVGTKVLNGSGEKIGDVNDIIVDRNGRVNALVLGVGGYLGFNEKSVAVPFYQVQVGDVLGGSRIVVLNATKDELKAAPAYTITDPTKTDRLKKLAKDWGTKAKERAIELSKKAAEKAQEMKDKAAEALKKKEAQ